MVKGTSSQYAVTIGYAENLPFEVWVLANEQPRGLGAVAKTLSADMRARDSMWLTRKLEALAGVVGGNSIDQPIYCNRLVASSNSATLAKVIQAWLAHEKTPSHVGTPIMNALLPAFQARNTLAFAAPVVNPDSGDDFMVFMPEVETEDGQQIPTGVHLSGRYPADLDGLTTLLSLDMRVADVSWIGMKLRKLLDFSEPMGDFMARHAKTGKQERFASIIAYIAHIMVHRYATLGLLDAKGYPILKADQAVRLVA
jgi:ribonucleoside-diphosphate reductase alpha chain